MTSTTGRMPLAKMLVVFMAVLILGNVMVAAVEYMFPDLKVPSSMGILLAMIGAISAGQSGAKDTGRSFSFGEKALFAFAATLLSVLMGVGLLWGVFAWYGVPFTVDNAILAMTGEEIPLDEIKDLLVWVLPAVLIFEWLLIFFGVALGTRGYFKAQERQAAKGK